MMQKRQAFVTGGSGYLAKHIISQLVAAGWNVRYSVRSPERASEVAAAVESAVGPEALCGDRLEFVVLDLLSAEGWQEALAGVDALVHTASPFPLVQPRDESEVVRPAVIGTLNVLRAAAAAGVRRVVMTSSIAAVMYPSGGRDSGVLDEESWTNPVRAGLTPYVRSKTLAERAAWDHVQQDAPEIALTVINPGFIVGPALDGNVGTSLSLIQRILAAKDPMLPQFGYPVVDVRDVAAMHVRALETPAAAGQRVIASERFLWFAEMAELVKAEFPGRGIVTRQAPGFVIRVIALFDRSVRTILPDLGRQVRLNSEKAKNLLGIRFRDSRDSIRATARSLVEQGLA